MASDLYSALFAGGGVALAALTVGLFSVFPGARLAGLFLVILAGVLFWASRLDDPRAKRQPWLRTPLDGPILLLLVQLAVSFWASALPEKSWIALCQVAAGPVAYYAVVNWSRDRVRLRWTVIALIALGLGLALVAPFAVDWFRERKTFLPPSLYDFFPLLLSDSIHPNVMAGSLVTLMPLSLALSLNLSGASKRQRYLRGALLVIYLVQVGIVILTKSRGGYLAVGAGLWLTLWLSGRRRWAIGLTLLAILVIIWLLLRAPAQTGEGLDPTQAALDASTWAFRQRVWRTAVLLIGGFPFTGVGVGTFNDMAAILYGFYSPQNPGVHNLLLHVTVDLGFLGLVSFLAMLLLVLWSGLQTYRLLDPVEERILRALAIGGLAGIVATITHGLVDSHTWGSKGAFIPWLVMGLLVALYSLVLPRSPGQTNVEGVVDR